MQIVAHRGARRLALENSLAALRVAYEEGADGVEFDVQISADGEPVLFHDDDLWRLGGQRAAVHTLPWRALRDLPLQDEEGRRGTMPHLDEALELLLRCGGLRNLELKVVADRGLALAEAVARRLALTADATWWVSSFDRIALTRFATAKLGCGVAALVDDVPCDFSALAAATSTAEAVDACRSGLGGRLGAVHPHHTQVDASRVAAWQAADLRVHPYTVNGYDGWRRMRDCGVNAVITDDPGPARAYLTPRPI